MIKNTSDEWVVFSITPMDVLKIMNKNFPEARLSGDQIDAIAKQAVYNAQHGEFHYNEMLMYDIKSAYIDKAYTDLYVRSRGYKLYSHAIANGQIDL